MKPIPRIVSKLYYQNSLYNRLTVEEPLKSRFIKNLEINTNDNRKTLLPKCTLNRTRKFKFSTLNFDSQAKFIRIIKAILNSRLIKCLDITLLNGKNNELPLLKSLKKSRVTELIIRPSNSLYLKKNCKGNSFLFSLVLVPYKLENFEFHNFMIDIPINRIINNLEISDMLVGSLPLNGKKLKSFKISENWHHLNDSIYHNAIKDISQRNLMPNLKSLKINLYPNDPIFNNFTTLHSGLQTISISFELEPVDISLLKVLEKVERLKNLKINIMIYTKTRISDPTPLILNNLEHFDLSISKNTIYSKIEKKYLEFFSKISNLEVFKIKIMNESSQEIANQILKNSTPLKFLDLYFSQIQTGFAINIFNFEEMKNISKLNMTFEEDIKSPFFSFMISYNFIGKLLQAAKQLQNIKILKIAFCSSSFTGKIIEIIEIIRTEYKLTSMAIQISSLSFEEFQNLKLKLKEVQSFLIFLHCNEIFGKGTKKATQLDFTEPSFKN